jgi:pilus assembly protein Flp/PilA
MIWVQSARALKDTRRAVTALEYGMIAALIAAVIVTAVTTLGTTLNNIFVSVSSPF